MVAKDDIKLVVFKGKVADVRLDVSQGRIQVRGGVLQVRKPSESFVESLFRGKVEHAQAVGKKIGFAFQVQPEKPVPFQG